MIPFNLCPGGQATYQITNSVRLRAAASAYFSRTFGTPTNNTTWTLSFWHKKAANGTGGNQNIFANAGSENDCIIFTNSTDTLRFIKATAIVATSSAVFRDPSAHYNFCFVSNGTTVKGYRNNEEVISYTGTIPELNKNATAFYLGARSTGAAGLDGYLSDAYFIDGQALTPSSFGELNSDNVWVPKAYAGTYGNNGFHLDFKDANLTAGSNVGLGKDVSGNGNYWNTNNISVTAGVMYDSMVDTPTNNFCTANALDKYGSLTLSNGELTFADSASAVGGMGWRASVGVSSGKWYWEITQTATQNSRAICSVSVDAPNTAISAANTAGSGAIVTSYAYLQANGNKVNNASSVAYGASWTTGDVIGVALDMTNGKVYFSKNGTWQNSGDPVAGTGFAFSGLSGTLGPSGVLYHDAFDGSLVQIDANFGQAPLATGATYNSASGGYFKYTPPTGFKALCTANLPAVAITNPSNGIKHRWEAGSGIAANIASDRASWTNWIEIFKRTDTTEDWKLRFSSDIGNMMACNTNAAKTAWSAPSAGTYLGLAIQAEATYGCVTGTYAGDNTSNRNITHSLGRVPTCGIVKNEASGDWFFWHTKMTGAAYFTVIDNASPPAQSNTNTPWGTGNWSSTQFMVTNNATNNANANAAVYRYILFSDISGMLAMLGFTGNGSTDGAFEWVNQRPQIQIEKDLAAATSFYLFSDLIDTYNATASYLVMNTTAATAAATGVDIVSNGIKHRSATIANAADAYAAISFARCPFGGSNVSPSPAR